MKKIFSIFLMIISFSLLLGCSLDSLKVNKGNNKNEKTEETEELIELKTPTVTISSDGIASWKAVKNADGYAYKINNGKEKTITETKVQLSLGDSIKVKAVGDGEEYEDSPYSKTVTYGSIEHTKTPVDGEYYTITFYKNDGTKETYTQTYKNGDYVYLAFNTFYCEGYTFKGWATTSTGSVKYSDGQSLGYISKDLNLYAVWEKSGISSVRITYHSNNGYNETKTYYETYGNYATAAYNDFYYSGYKFVGWATWEYGPVEYYEGSFIGYAYSDMNLYAVWEYNNPTTYQIRVTYHSNDGFYNEWSEWYDSGSYVSASYNYNFNREGYVFVGWATWEYGSVVYYEGWSIGYISSDMDLYAVWEKVTYTVRYHSNDGYDNIVYQDCSYNDYIYALYGQFSREGYSFVGWATWEYGSVVYYEGWSIGYMGSDMDLYAVWEPIEISVHFEANGGYGYMDTQYATYGYGFYLNYNNFYRDGYTFLGWSTWEYGSVEFYDQDYVCLHGDITLYAVWQSNEKVITYYANYSCDISGEVSFQYVYSDNTYLNPSMFTNPGYKFIGWSTSPYGSVEFSDQSYIYLSGDLTLYAVWEAYTNIYLYANGTYYPCEYISGMENGAPTYIAAFIYVDSYSTVSVCDQNYNSLSISLSAYSGSWNNYGSYLYNYLSGTYTFYITVYSSHVEVTIGYSD